MNFQEINEALKKHYDEDVDAFAYESDNKEIPGIGNMTEIAQKGGEGEEWYSVKHFPEHDVFIRINGSYASYSGTYFDDWNDAVKEVRPQEKTITVYE